MSGICLKFFVANIETVVVYFVLEFTVRNWLFEGQSTKNDGGKQMWTVKMKLPRPCAARTAVTISLGKITQMLERGQAVLEERIWRRTHKRKKQNGHHGCL